MAQGLPYFQFYISEWLLGDIQECSFEAKGVFADLCAYYWKKDCELSISSFLKRSSQAQAGLNELEKWGIIAVINSDFSEKQIVIEFLDEQYKKLNKTHMKHVVAGRKGGKTSLSQAKAKLKPASSIKKRIEENRLIDTTFDNYLKIYKEKLGLQTVHNRKECEKRLGQLNKPKMFGLEKHIEEYAYLVLEIRSKHIPDYQARAFQVFLNSYMKNDKWMDELREKFAVQGEIDPNNGYVAEHKIQQLIESKQYISQLVKKLSLEEAIELEKMYNWMSLQGSINIIDNIDNLTDGYKNASVFNLISGRMDSSSRK